MDQRSGWMLFRRWSVSGRDRRPSTDNYGMAATANHHLLATSTEHSSISAAYHGLSTTHHSLHRPVDCLRRSADRICRWRRCDHSSHSTAYDTARLPGELLFDPSRSWPESSNHRHWTLRDHPHRCWCPQAVIEAWYMDADSVGDRSDSLLVAHRMYIYSHYKMSFSH